MTISKINSTSFKGFLTISDGKNNYRYNTNDITGIVDNSQKRTVTIYGMETDTFGYSTNKQQNINISYNAISPYDVMSGYAAASSAKNDIDIVIIGNKNCPIEKANTKV